jgi:HAD superfamily hydrolase (TIGR01509 family)
MVTVSNLLESFRDKQYLFFDLDGTLVDSSPCHERAYLSALDKHAPHLAPRFCYETFKGKRTDESFTELGVSDPTLVRELTAHKQADYRARVERGEVQLIAAARELLQHLHDGRRKLFLVTSASARSTEAILTHFHLKDFFQDIVTGNDVAKAKPAPDCYLHAIDAAGIDASLGIAIEDAEAGISSAREAGLHVIAVNNAELAGRPEYAGPLEQLLHAFHGREEQV